MPSQLKKFKWPAIILVLSVLAFFYGKYDPAAETTFFPKCPLKAATGLKCPGCGSQRAVHQLLNLNVEAAMHYNAMLVLSIPYLILGFVFDSIKNWNDKLLKWRNRLFGTTAIWIVLALVIGFWVLRNII